MNSRQPAKVERSGFGVRIRCPNCPHVLPVKAHQECGECGTTVALEVRSYEA